MQRKPIAVSLFSGAGGLDLGMKQAGFDIRLCVDADPTCCQTLKENHMCENIYVEDVSKLTKKDIYLLAKLDQSDRIDLLFGGSPCQSFSTAGKKKGFSDERGMLTFHFFRLVEETQPHAFLLENTKGILSKKFIKDPLSFFSELAPSYRVSIHLLNAADYGVPQTRQRAFIVGVHRSIDKEYIPPEPTHQCNGENGKKKWVTVREALTAHSIKQHHHLHYSPSKEKWMKLIPKGGGCWKDLFAYGEDVVKEAMGNVDISKGGSTGFFRRICENKPAPTILTSPTQKSTMLGHPYEDRPLSIEEYLIFQTFPLDYKIAGGLRKQYMQIGNAVPVLLAKQIAKSIRNVLS